MFCKVVWDKELFHFFFFLRLFQDVKQASSSTLLKALPLKLQQTAFENAYLKAQEGMREVVNLVMHIRYYILFINILYITLPCLSW